MKTPTSSQYPVLDNRPIDQWKVTELKEELKRRRLKTGGLKDELVRRLDGTLRTEMGETNVEGDNDNGVEEPESENVVIDAPANVTEQPVAEAGDSIMVAYGNAEQTMGNTEETVGESKENAGNAGANVVSIEVDCKDSVEQLGKDVSVEEQQFGLGNVPVFGEGMVSTTDTASVIMGSEVIEEQQSGLVDDLLSREGLVTVTDVASVIVDDEVREGFPPEKAMAGDGLVNGRTERDNGDSGEQVHSEDLTPAHEDVKLDFSVQNNQVSEVSISVGFPIKSNISVSTDSLSIIEKNVLKDNLIADNVKLESDVKPEMVQPSSSDLVPDGGESHLRDVDEPHENKNSAKETDYSVANADMSQKNSADLGSEKLNVDQSSDDDSMEEDALEDKKIDSNCNYEDVGKKTETDDVSIIKAETVATTMDMDLHAEKKVIHGQKNDVATLSDKRKLSEEDSVLNNKPAKKQHRWKTESNTATELQTSLIPPPASTLDVPQSIALRRSFSRSDSIGANDPPKEREVPPPTKPATSSLRIDRFLRPFTLKAVQELLGKTGTVTSFWMDHIKTHCYVTYSSVEEAVETRNAVYNLQWPPNGGRQLVAEFVDPKEVILRLEPLPPAPAPPVNSAPTKAPEPLTIPQPSPRQQKSQQPDALPPPPPMLNQAPVREWLPPPPPPIEKVDAPFVTLDDLFRKTKAAPRIYYLPLSDEQVAARRKNSNQ